MDINALPPWESLMKRMVWQQLGEIRGQRILDFGSGEGVTACRLARDNEVTAIEPDENAVKRRWQEHSYRQLTGSTDQLRMLPNAYFDLILCHNVLEYAPDRAEIMREFARVLKPDGVLSVVKHNRAGRVMQLAVLLNEFERAHRLLDGTGGETGRYGLINHYEDEDLIRWCDAFQIERTLGMRTFWDLQQNQEIQKDAAWQENMLALEMRVSELEPYRSIAFCHHLLLKKRAAV